MDIEELDIGSVITAPSTSFVVKDVLGQGAFGEVALCRNTRSRKTVALKIIKKEEDMEDAKCETKILKKLKQRGSEEHNIVHWFSSFKFRATYCLEFEKLDISLSDFIAKTIRMSLLQIRPVLHQMATAMKFIKNLGIVHADVKPENIMMVDHPSSLKVKMIDFGAAHPVKLVKRGFITQTACYRAPEVFVGAKYNHAIDVWSLGCVALEMLMGKLLFQSEEEDDVLRHIVKTVGTPPNMVLRRGKFTDKYFHRKKVRGTPVWRLKSQLKRFCFRERTMNSLKDLHLMGRKYLETSSIDREVDWKYFVDLVLKLLCLDPKERITPEEILEQPFISMRHIVNVFDSEHVSQSMEMMECVCSRPREQQAVDNEEPSTSTGNKGLSSKRSRDKDNEEKTSPDRSSQNATKKRRKTVAVKGSSSSSQAPPSGSRKRTREFTKEQALDRPKLALKRRKGTPFSKVVPLVSEDDQASPSSSSRKRSREDEEDTGQRRSLKIPRAESRLVPRLILVGEDQVPSQDRQESGSRKRDREDEEDEEKKRDGSSMVLKRRRPD